MEVCPVGAALSHVDERTYMPEVIGDFRDYAEEPKMVSNG
jgi:hypothetical protein